MKHKKRGAKKRTIVVFTIFLLIALVVILLKSGFALPAQIADNILRPALGSKNTITLEAYYFAIGDQWEKLKYRVFPKSVTSVNFADGETQDPPEATNSGNLTLTLLSSDNSLPSLADEGKWKVIPQVLFPNQPVMAQTFIRPDATHPYAIVSLVQMDMKSLGIGAEAGTYYPGGERKLYGNGIVPLHIQRANSLVAVFNGGFQEKDGHYGMVVGNTTYVPLKKNLATLVMKQDGTFSMIDYQDQQFDTTVTSIRQNGSFLMKDSAITPFVEQGIDTWGRTTTNSIYTWRSGIGITKEGNLVYAVGNSLVPKTLAIALQKAGAVNAMQLDINPFWVRFILYTSLGNGTYSYLPLITQMHDGGYQYLHGYNKDFFYVYKKF